MRARKEIEDVVFWANTEDLKETMMEIMVELLLDIRDAVASPVEIVAQQGMGEMSPEELKNGIIKNLEKGSVAVKKLMEADLGGKKSEII